MRVEFVILGEPASKANSREIVTFGKGDDKRAALIKSQKARTYERDALRQIPSRARLRMTGPVRVSLRIFYASERPDLDESLILDSLQDRFKGKGEARQLVQPGVYRNDRQVRSKRVDWALDKRNPRAEIVVEPLQPQQSDLIPPPWVDVDDPFAVWGRHGDAMSREPRDLLHVLRNQAWERAKGELRSVLVTYYSSLTAEDDNKYEAMSKAVADFIAQVEAEGWAE